MARVPLRKILKKERISVRAFAKGMKKPSGTVYRWFDPDWNPRLDTLSDIAKFLKKRVRDLIEE